MPDEKKETKKPEKKVEIRDLDANEVEKVKGSLKSNSLQQNLAKAS